MNFDAAPHTSDTWPLRLLRRPWLYAVMAATLLGSEFVMGSWVQFPIAFVIPVALAAWFCPPPTGYVLAAAMPVTRFCFVIFWNRSGEFEHTLVNATIRAAVLLFIAYLAASAGRLTREVRVLRGLLPVCAYCKKIRDKDDTWQPIETYITQRSEARFSHGICPECTRIHFGKDLDPRHRS